MRSAARSGGRRGAASLAHCSVRLSFRLTFAELPWRTYRTHAVDECCSCETSKINHDSNDLKLLASTYC